jgi:RNA polymerase sigma factor (sigma-70 family)
MQDSDEALMLAYAGGDMKAFDSLYARHREQLYGYILRFCADAALANDLYQGSWEKIIKARKRYRSSAPFKAWMYRIARNHVVDHFRRQKPVSAQEPDTLADTASMPDQQLSEQQQKARLQQAIDQLPEEQKEVVLLKLEAGLDLATIAEITGVNVDTAKSRLRYAVRKLKLGLEATEQVTVS